MLDSNVCLLLSGSPGLTWRDVQYITLMTARPLPDGQWITNGVGRKGKTLFCVAWFDMQYEQYSI